MTVKEPDNDINANVDTFTEYDLAPAIYFKQALDDDINVAAVAAQKLGVKPEQFNVFFKDLSLNRKFDSYMTSLRHDPTLTVKQLTKLANNGSVYARGIAASHNNTPPQVLSQLVYDNNYAVMLEAVRNENLPTEHLLQLIDDVSNKELRKEAISNSRTPVNKLVELSSDESADIRAEVAFNPNTPLPVLTILAEDEEESVRYNVSLNKNIDGNILNKLADSDSLMIFIEVASNPNVTTEMLERMFLKSVNLRNNLQDVSKLYDLYIFDNAIESNQRTPQWVKDMIALTE